MALFDTTSICNGRITKPGCLKQFTFSLARLARVHMRFFGESIGTRNATDVRRGNIHIC